MGGFFAMASELKLGFPYVAINPAGYPFKIPLQKIYWRGRKQHLLVRGFTLREELVEAYSDLSFFEWMANRLVALDMGGQSHRRRRETLQIVGDTFPIVTFPGGLSSV